jgi:hypothetical protein
MTTTFEDFFYDWCATRANELDGPNSPDWDRLHERLMGDEVEEQRARDAYENVR